MKYSFLKICIIFNQYFPVFHYFVFNKKGLPLWKKYKVANKVSHLIIIPPANFVVGILFSLYPPQTLFVVGILFSRCPCVRVCVRACVRPSVMFCFFNILKNHCWIFIKPCKHVHICKTNTLDKKVRTRGQFY